MKIFLKNKGIKKEKAFTLVESLISITILMISVAAPLNLASQGLIAAGIAQRQIVAFYLAQDATEWIINQKLSNHLVSGAISMLNGLDDCIIDGVAPDFGCAINTLNTDTTQAIDACTSADCPQGKLYKNSSGFYQPDSAQGGFSGYTRYSKIDILSSESGFPKEARISTIVKWISAQGKDQSYNLVTNISNW